MKILSLLGCLLSLYMPLFLYQLLVSPVVVLEFWPSNALDNDFSLLLVAFLATFLLDVLPGRLISDSAIFCIIFKTFEPSSLNNLACIQYIY